MFNKVHKNAVAVVLALGLFGGVSPCLAETLVPYTPYDQRLLKAGALENAWRPAGQARSAEELFLQARSFRYRQDESGRDHWQTPEETQARWAGDCEDKAIWLYAQLKMNGYQGVRLVVGRQNPSSKSLHMWVTLEDVSGGGCLYVMDPTAQRKMWKCTDFPQDSYVPLYSFDGHNRYRHSS